MIEIMIVIAVMLIIAAAALPSITRSLAIYRLGGAATNAANMIQRTRFEAIRLNTNVSVRWQQQPDQTWIMWVDFPPAVGVPANGVVDVNEPMIILPSQAGFLANAPVAPQSMGYPNTQIPNGFITFDGRGTVSFAGGAPTVYVIYIGNQKMADNGYRAVSVPPTGKPKLWVAAATGYWHTP